MGSKKVAVLGAGNSGYAMAADLTLAGYKVSFYGSKQRGNLDPIIRRGGIEVEGNVAQGFAKIDRITTNIAEAIADARLIMVTYRSEGQGALAELCAPYLEDGQTIVLTPGNLGSVLFAKILAERGVHKNIRIAETQSSMYGSRRVGNEARVTIIDRIWNNVAAFPAKDTEEVITLLRELYPETAVPARNVMEVFLGTLVSHVPRTILNAGIVEDPERPFWVHAGATTSVRRVEQAVKQENAAIIEKLGLRNLIKPFEERIAKNPPPGRDKIPGPKDMQHRYVSEDCPYGLVPRASLGDMIGVPTPVTKALITIASEMNETDYFKTGRTMESMGIAGLSSEQLNEFLITGKK